MATGRWSGGFNARAVFLALFLVSVLVLSACSVCRSPSTHRAPAFPAITKVDPLGFTIQAGAFSNIENASRFADHLNAHDLDAYYYISEKDLYRVRFGDYFTREDALRKARQLQELGIIEEYYIVRPDDYSLSQRSVRGDQFVRARLVDTARGYIGVPYRWGGSSEEEGFDCSGLTMSVYRLNGFNLPRNSREQFRTGRPVDSRALSEGDLVFFDTRGRGYVSHVGIYAGNGRFIHAPRTGRAVSVESLNDAYYRSRFMGARTYM